MARLGMFNYWAPIAIEAEYRARLARDGKTVKDLLRDGEDPSASPPHLGREFESSLLCITACAITVESLRRDLNEVVVVGESGAAWKRVLRTIRQAFHVSEEQIGEWRPRLERLFSLRNTGVHFDPTWNPPGPHPSGTKTNVEFAWFSLEEAEKAVDLMTEILGAVFGGLKPRSQQVTTWLGWWEQGIPPILKQREIWRRIAPAGA